MKEWKALVLAGCLLIGSAGLAATDLEPDWVQSFNREIKWQKLSDSGFLILGTDEALFALDPATGKTAWSLDQFKKMPEDFIEMLPGTQFAAITYKGGSLGFGSTTYMVDVTSGTVVWDSAKLELGNSIGQFYLPEAGGLLLFGTDKKGKMTLKLVDLATGGELWSNDGLYKKHPAVFPISEKKKLRMGVGGNQMPLFLPGKGILELVSPMGLRLLDAKTGQVSWTSKLKVKAVPALKSGYAQMAMSRDGQALYIPMEHELWAVKLSDGSLLWPKPAKLKGAVYQMEVTEQGVVLRGGPGGSKGKGKPFITVLDPASGQQTWKKPFKDLENASSFSVKEGRILIYADRAIHSIDLKDGSSREQPRTGRQDQAGQRRDPPHLGHPPQRPAPAVHAESCPFWLRRQGDLPHLQSGAPGQPAGQGGVHGGDHGRQRRLRRQRLQPRPADRHGPEVHADHQQSSDESALFPVRVIGQLRLHVGGRGQGQPEGGRRRDPGEQDDGGQREVRCAGHQGARIRGGRAGWPPLLQVRQQRDHLLQVLAGCASRCGRRSGASPDLFLATLATPFHLTRGAGPDVEE